MTSSKIKRFPRIKWNDLSFKAWKKSFILHFWSTEKGISNMFFFTIVDKYFMSLNYIQILIQIKEQTDKKFLKNVKPSFLPLSAPSGWK